MPVNGGTNQQAPIQTVGGTDSFQVQTGLVGQAGYPAAGPIKGAVIPYWSYGSGPPTATFRPPIGSLYTNTTITTSGATSLWVFKPNPIPGPGVWVSVI